MAATPTIKPERARYTPRSDASAAERDPGYMPVPGDVIIQTTTPARDTGESEHMAMVAQLVLEVIPADPALNLAPGSVAEAAAIMVKTSNIHKGATESNLRSFRGNWGRLVHRLHAIREEDVGTNTIIKTYAIGGDGDFVNKVLGPRLLAYGLQLIGIHTMDTARPPVVPQDAELILVFSDMAPHGHSDAAIAEAKRRNIPFIRGTRKWANLQQVIERAGLVARRMEAPTPPAPVPVAEVPAPKCEKCKNPLKPDDDTFCATCLEAATAPARPLAPPTPARKSREDEAKERAATIMAHTTKSAFAGNTVMDLAATGLPSMNPELRDALKAKTDAETELVKVKRQLQETRDEVERGVLERTRNERKLNERIQRLEHEAAPLREAAAEVTRLRAERVAHAAEVTRMNERAAGLNNQITATKRRVDELGQDLAQANQTIEKLRGNPPPIAAPTTPVARAMADVAQKAQARIAELETQLKDREGQLKAVASLVPPPDAAAAGGLKGLVNALRDRMKAEGVAELVIKPDMPTRVVRTVVEDL
jgi:hypothetical protein